MELRCRWKYDRVYGLVSTGFDRSGAIRVFLIYLYPLTTLINPFYFSYRNTLIPSHVALKAQAQPDLCVKFEPI